MDEPDPTHVILSATRVLIQQPTVAMKLYSEFAQNAWQFNLNPLFSEIMNLDESEQRNPHHPKFIQAIIRGVEHIHDQNLKKMIRQEISAAYGKTVF